MPAFSVRLYRYPGPWQVQLGTDLMISLTMNMENNIQ
ncbi:hypothetical protein FOXB_11657 [Fusarium oxysporum f. sp. conglutinans Fo5176]|uniref:Uncharacterized protein n=1 Tax=Fusarium oxysporum (strain Fo5176) TaxID=660025 RepID=F9FZ68_FUSOF|nr:hypothetical protein FOXB_11657 [Fusarium oxysporum f. sp. conglutinans Fo5176]